MRVAICSNKRAEREEIAGYVRAWGEEQEKKIESKGYESGKQFLYNFTEGSPLDLILISVEQGVSEMTGMALAKVIRACKEEVGIVFISDSMESIYEGYEVSILYYLLRPLKRREIEKCLELQEKRVEKREDKYLLIEEREDIRRLRYQDISYVSSNSHYIEVYTRTGMIKVRKRLREIREELSREEFIEIHRSYIVNLGQIEEFKGQRIRLSSGKDLPVSRGKKKELKEQLLHFYRE